MRFHRTSEFTGGWFIGDFEPSLLRTKEFEVAVKEHPAGEDWPEHYHAVATEYNYLCSGEMVIGEDVIEVGDIFVIDPGESVKPHFYTDCVIVTIKVPSIPGDKYVVHKP